MEKIRNVIAGKKNWVPWILIAGFGVVYLSLCFNNNIWTDEGFTIDLLRNCNTFAEVCDFTAADVHPPLYYLILKVFTDLFGMNLTLMKIVSILPMLMTMALGPLLFQKEFGYRTSLLFVIILGTLPCTMEYAVQVRMYSWAILFVTLCGIEAYRIGLYDKKVNWIFYTIGGVAAAYTHYFAFAAVLWIYGFLFLYLCFFKRKALGYWFGCSVVSAIAYVPWLSQMARQIGGVSGNYWISEITGKVIASYFPWIVETNLPYVTAVMAVIFLLALLLLGYQIWNNKGLRRTSTAALFSLLIPVLVVVTGVVLSRLIRPIFIIRYIMPSIGLLCLFLAIAFSWMEKQACVAIGAFFMTLGLIDYQNTYYDEYQATYTAQTEEFFENNLGENDIVVYNYYAYLFIYEYYFDREQLVYLEDVDLSGNYGDIWFLDTPLNLDFNGEQLAANGWMMEDIGQYGIEQNEFRIIHLYR